MKKTKEIEKILKALANHRRLDILAVLKERRNITVGEIAETIKLSFKSTSRHLGVLAAAGIVERDQISLEVYYKISSEMPLLARQVLAFV